MSPSHELPPGLSLADEGRHAPPEGIGDKLFGDTLWVSVVDPEANVCGVNHFHLTNKGYGRFETYYVIDGVQQSYGQRIPLDPEPDDGPWTDGTLTYEVIDPMEHIRISMDGPRYGFQLDFTGRLPGLRLPRLGARRPSRHRLPVPQGPLRAGHGLHRHLRDPLRPRGGGDPPDQLLVPSRPHLVGSVLRPARVGLPGGPHRRPLLAVDPAARPSHQHLRLLLRLQDGPAQREQHPRGVPVHRRGKPPAAQRRGGDPRRRHRRRFAPRGSSATSSPCPTAR